MNDRYSENSRLNNKNSIDRVSWGKMYFLIMHRKRHLIFWILLSVLAVFLFNYFSDPVYESTVILKKEQIQDSRSGDEIGRIIAMQTLDEVETEIEIVKSRTVLEKLADDLLLAAVVSEVSVPSGESFRSDQPYPDYQDYLATRPDLIKKLPVLTGISLPTEAEPLECNLLISGKNQVTLSLNDETIFTGVIDGGGNLSVRQPDAIFTVHWPEAAIGSRMRFCLQPPGKILQKLFDSISLKRLGKTNLFQISARAGSPVVAQTVAQTLVEKFREVRLEQKQQTIRYSFNFVDQQLRDTEERLRAAEDTLSKFKSRYQITSIDQNSAEIIDFLSKLEGGKVDTDLQLAEYENRLSQMKNEHLQKGYFDQTYLTPSNADESYSPFSSLLKELSDLELRKLELLQRRKETHPDVVTLNNQIDQIKGKLSSYNQNTITAYEILIRSLREKRNNIEKLIASYSVRIGKLPETESRLAELIRQRDALEKKFSLLLDKREEMRMAELSKLQDIVVIDEAQRPLKPVFPKKKLNLALGLFAGFLLGILSIFLREYLSEKLTDIEYIEKELQIPLLAIVPPFSRQLNRKIQTSASVDGRFVTLLTEEHGLKESYRIMRVKLQNQLPRKYRTVLITSGEENTGKTTVSANLAISLSQAGEKVLLVDGDLRKGTLSKLFQIPPESPGLVEYLQGEAALSDLEHTPLSEHDLKVISSGKPHLNSGELLDTEKLLVFFKAVQTTFDVIIVDTPPVTKVVDPLLLGKIVRQVVLVVKPDLTVKESIRAALGEFHQAGMNLLGVVANSSSVDHSFYRYRYGYGYGYQAQKEGTP